MNLPNILTLSRMILTVGFIYCLTQAGLSSIMLAIFFFTCASLTDFYDGYFAKRWNLISNFGKIMDPIADKFLTLAAFFVFARMHIVAEWMFYLILAREILVTGSRLFVMKRGQYLVAEKAGKWKTVLQIVAISVILIFLMLREASPLIPGGGVLNHNWLPFWRMGINILMWLTVALTVLSGFSYLWNNSAAFQKSKNPMF